MTLRSRISVEIGDITAYEVDMIVNAANAALSGGGGVDGAIHAAAGQELYAACRALGRAAPGETKVTPGFDLKAKWIAHAVGPVWRGGEHGEAELLAACYRGALNHARDYDCASIAFPAISTGAYRFPIDKAAAIAVETVAASLLENAQVGQVVFVCSHEKVRAAHMRALATVLQ